MSLEAVEYVKEAEERAKKIVINGNEKITEIIKESKNKIVENQEIMKQELINYELDQQEVFNAQLDSEKQKIDAELSVEVEAMLKSVEKKKQNVIDGIVKEVINHYGNS